MGAKAVHNVRTSSKTQPAVHISPNNGLTDRHREGLVVDGFDCSELDAERAEIVIPADYYGCEFRDSWQERGEASMGNLQNQMQRIIEELEVCEIESTTDLSDAALEQLKGLGYT